MASEQAKMENYPPKRTQRSFVVSQVLLRIIAFGATLAATVIMATNKQTVTLFGFPVDAKFSYTPTFRFFVGGNALACAYSLLSLPFVFNLTTQGSDPGSYFFVFLLDLIMMVLLMASAAAATAISYVGKNGNSHIGWSAICDHLSKFCDKAGASLVCSFAGFILFFLLTILSAHRHRQTSVSSC